MELGFLDASKASEVELPLNGLSEDKGTRVGPLE
jgi:hypothetical protein